MHWRLAERAVGVTMLVASTAACGARTGLLVDETRDATSQDAPVDVSIDVIDVSWG